MFEETVVEEPAAHGTATDWGAASGRAVEVLLCGGPADQLPEHERVREVLDPEAAIKVPLGAHYDHYRPTGRRARIGDRHMRVFAWSHRTFVAE